MQQSIKGSSKTCTDWIVRILIHFFKANFLLLHLITFVCFACLCALHMPLYLDRRITCASEVLCCIFDAYASLRFFARRSYIFDVKQSN